MPQTMQWTSARWAVLLLTLTATTFCLHGYHPLAEDGGLYVAGVEYLLDPALFPHYTAFVQEHLRFSLFAPAVAAMVRLSHLPLLWVLFVLDLLSIWLTFFAGLQIVRCLTPQRAHARDRLQLAALALLAAWWTMPVAGTSLLLMDPYLTARSFSTALTLLAIAFALEAATASRVRASVVTRIITCLIAAALLHPLMAAYALAWVVVILCWRTSFSTRCSVLALAACLLLALLIATAMQVVAAPEPPALRIAVITRYYWFLSQWQWYELIGIVAPLLVFAAMLRYGARFFSPAFAVTCRAAMTLGVSSIFVALLFAREDMATHAVARLQPLRLFLPLYALMVLCLGLCVQQGCERFLPRLRVRVPTAFIATMACVMGFVQQQTFPLSPHVEWPWRAARNNNPWVQAFLWARANTPRDALFALDAKYVNMRGEDAQTFRATALRSALPDYSKDGGEAAITPPLAEPWQAAADAQKDLSALGDTTRDARLMPLGTTWMVLTSGAPTSRPCPYDNGTVKVCRLR